MTLSENFPPQADPEMAKNRVSLPVKYATVILELLADVEADQNGQLPLLDGEQIGHRQLTNTERLAVDELKARTLRALRFG